MIKRILVALDPDSDSRIATQYAVHIAQRTDARITGLAVVDTKTIEVSARGGGIGSMYYAEKLRENLTQETRNQARYLIVAGSTTSKSLTGYHMSKTMQHLVDNEQIAVFVEH